MKHSNAQRGLVNLFTSDSYRLLCLLARLQTDTLQTVPTICDGRAFSSPLVSLLGVRHIPGILLLNAEGRIVARDIAPKNLEQRVSDLLK